MTAIILKPDIQQKLDILAQDAKYDVCMSSCNSNGTSNGRIPDPVDPSHKWIFPAHLPGGGAIQMLKVLQTNHCKNKCTYCGLSALKDQTRRVTLSADELAKAFMSMVAARLVEGIFLSSGVCNHLDSSMEKMVRTAEILRNKFQFEGYIHIKILPGISFSLLEQATALATRVSVNLEAPAGKFLDKIAPDKSFAKDLISRMKWAGDLIRKGTKTTSQTTQFVVGASEETDLDILRTVDWVYREMFVFRSYFSAFQQNNKSARPVMGQKFKQEKTTLLREHRLYQTDYLLRGYGFGFKDLVFNQNDRLPNNVDPKTAWAMMHPEIFPVDINKADIQQLLKVPGIGPLSAQRIVQNRAANPYHNIEELKGSGAVVKRVAPYVEFSGKGILQQRLFEALPPSGWKSGITPIDSLIEKDNSDDENRSILSDKQSPYPGQKGKPLYYSRQNNTPRTLCR